MQNRAKVPQTVKRKAKNVTYSDRATAQRTAIRGLLVAAAMVKHGPKIVPCRISGSEYTLHDGNELYWYNRTDRSTGLVGIMHIEPLLGIDPRIIAS
jgi:hypothetical protein